MTTKKQSKLAKRDKEWQEKIEKKLDAEKVDLGHPQGKERFEQTIKRSRKKKSQ